MKKGLMFFGIFLFLFANIFHVSASLNVTLSDQGSNVISKSTGAALTSGDLSVYIYDSASGGSIVYSENFTGGIVNGSWNLILGENSSNQLSLEFGKIYYKDYYINGQNLDFTSFSGTTTDRQLFYSPLGDIAGSYVKQNANLTIYNLSAAGNVSAPNFLGNLAGNLNGYSSDYFFPVNTSVTGTFDFNGNWQSGGLTIQQGAIYAQAGYFYNISSLQVNNLNINGSFFPYVGFSNAFDLGNSSLMWNDLWLGGNANVSGDIFASRLIGNIDYTNITNPFNFTSATFTAYNSTWDESYLIAGLAMNTSAEFQSRLNNTMLNLSSLQAGTLFANDTMVGIGTSTPSNTLDVRGIGNFSGILYYNNVTVVNSTFFTTMNNTNTIQQLINDTNMYFSSLGVGTTSPTHLLNVFGNTNLSGNVYLGNNSMLFVNGSNVGIRTATPISTLHVVGNLTINISTGGAPNSVASSGLYFTNSTGDSKLVLFRGSGNSINIVQGEGTNQGILFGNYTDIIMRIGTVGTGAGAVGIGTTSATHRLQLSDNDAALASSTVWISIASDSRIKTNISEFTDGLNIIEKINPVNYNYNGISPEGVNNTASYIGLFADQLNSIAPYMAVPRNYTITEKDMEIINGMGIDTINKNTPYPIPKNVKIGDTVQLYGWSSNAFFFIFVNAFKEQQSQIQSLNQTINDLQFDNSKMKQSLCKLGEIEWC
ncbi:tail fiber domain-containing protein [Candidatus Pacearchaeota archaeon]|nr:tail fiber domain-containing protein [Candidatus Pacearchaeota archaeon]